MLSDGRGDVLTMTADAGALVALIYTARKHALDRQMFALSEQGQVTDRYSTAITQLASTKLEERIGRIHALKRIMADSPRDHPTVVEVLAAFVRERAPRPEAPAESGSNPAGPSTSAARPRADIHAAVTVLARRPDRVEPFSVDLRHASLTGLELPANTRLTGA